jgi:Zn-dependent M28 family amino/carboxypeptidase
MRHVRALSRRIGVRVRATRNERLAAAYVRAELRSLGYEVRVRRFGVDGDVSRNVVAFWPGAVPHGLLVGAHLDTVRGSPGANDNASGVAVLLEAARMAAGTPQVRWLRFVAFGSEEYGRDGRHHVGSQVYVNRLGPRGRRRQAGMISIDMVADGRPLLVGTAGIGPEIVARTVHRRMRSRIGVRYRTLCDCSDHGPFERAGIPAAFLWSGTEPDYHEPSDTPRNLSPADLRRTGVGVRTFLRAVDRKMIRRFRSR